MWSNKNFTKFLEKNQHSTLYSANNTCYISTRTRKKDSADHLKEEFRGESLWFKGGKDYEY